LAKKSRSSKAKTTTRKASFDWQQSAWFAPAGFAVVFIALMFLFRDFVFSDKMLDMSDQILAGVFFRMYLVKHFIAFGSFPQWMPHIFGGMPYIEAFHGDIFYPLSMMKLLAKDYTEFVRIQGWIMILHIYLAGIFMYLTARRFNLNKIAAMLSGICYMSAAYLVSLVAPGHDGKIFVTTLFPLVILCLELGFSSRRQFLWFSALGLVIGVIILSPHPQMSYFVLWAAALYTLFKLVVLYREKRSVLPLIKPASLAMYAVIIGLLLSAIQFYPGYMYTTHFSPRADTKQGWDWATSWSMHEEEAASLLVGEFAGVSTDNTQTYYWGKNFFKDNSESVGVVTIFMALIGFLFARRKEAYFFGGLGILALLYAVGATTPLFYLFYYLIPKVSSMRAPSMIMFLFSFSAALLAGMGLQRLMEAREHAREITGKGFNYLLFGFPSLLLVIALLFGAAGRGMISLWTSIFFSDAARMMVQQNVSKLDLAYMNLPAIQTGAWLAFLFTAIAATLIWLYRSGRMGTGILVVLLAVPLVDGVRFNTRFVAAKSPQQVWGNNPVADFLSKQPGHFRVMNLGVMSEDLPPFFGVDVVVGYHGNQLRWYDDLLGGPAKTNETNPRFLNLVGAKYLLIPSNRSLPDGYLGDHPVADAAIFGGVKVIKNDNAFERVFLVDQYKVFADRKQVTDEVLRGNSDMRRTVYLEKEPSLTITPDTLSADSAWIIHDSTEMVTVGLSCTHNQILVFTDNYFDAWQVSVDGQPAELLRAYGSFKAVAVPAGTQQVHFEYKSKRYETGRLATLLTSLYLLVVFGFYLVGGWLRKDKQEQEKA